MFLITSFITFIALITSMTTVASIIKVTKEFKLFAVAIGSSGEAPVCINSDNLMIVGCKNGPINFNYEYGRLGIAGTNKVFYVSADNGTAVAKEVGLEIPGYNTIYFYKEDSAFVFNGGHAYGDIQVDGTTIIHWNIDDTYSEEGFVPMIISVV